MSDFQPLSEQQRRILTFLLSQDFAGVRELREQISRSFARSVPGTDGFEIKVNPEAPAADVEVYVPVEAHYHNAARARSIGLNDGPGGLIEVLLHVSDQGYLEEVEEVLAVPRELLGPNPDITEFQLLIREWHTRIPSAWRAD